MHLPWTQVANEAVESGESLGRLLKVGDKALTLDQLKALAGIGLMVKLHRAALRHAPEGDFSGDLNDEHGAELVASWLAWHGDPAVLWKSLDRLGFVEGPPEGKGSRVKGLDRYESTWKRNRRQSPIGSAGEPPRNNRGNRSDPPSPESDADAESDAESDADRGSMSSQRASSKPEGGEDKKKGKGSGYDVEREVLDFFTWAKSVDDVAFGDPGPKVREWARGFFSKYQPETQDTIRAAFMKFVVWVGVEKKRPGWGLWISSEAIWLERYNAARVELGKS